MGQHRVQDFQVPADVQPVFQHLRARADRRRSIRSGAISHEGSQRVTKVLAIPPAYLDTVLRPCDSAGKMHRLEHFILSISWNSIRAEVKTSS